MRLLEYRDDGSFGLVNIAEKDLPPYAVLSHTWGADEEEVTFADLQKGDGKNKSGYHKLCFCSKQARRDGICFFWVDTCCINKSDFSELSEAINSMFRWYAKADKCYVYLSDISMNDQGQNDQLSHPAHKEAFQRSRWFTRGWTLQELLAPAHVTFFSKDGKLLGDKISLREEIHSITGIPVQVLQGTPLPEISIEERMSWGENRHTKKEEDAAYSLLGIVGVYMPLIYGEGQENAFRRLREEIYKRRSYESRPFQGEEDRRHSFPRKPLLRTTSRDDLEAATAEKNRLIEAADTEINNSHLNHPDQTDRLNKLANYFMKMLEKSCSRDDYDKAVDLKNIALRQTGDGSKKASILRDIEGPHSNWFAGTGSLQSRIRAIQAIIQEIKIIPQDHLERAERLECFKDLLNSLDEQSASTNDLCECAEAILKAIGRPAQYPDLVYLLSDLGSWLGERFRETHIKRSLILAIEVTTIVVDAMPKDDPGQADRWRFYIDLLRSRFQQTRSKESLEQATERLIKVVDATSLGQSSRAGLILILHQLLDVR